MATFFQAIATALTGTNKSLNIDVQGVANNQIKVLISANLGPVPADAGPEETKLRVALAKPMLITGTAEQIEDALASRLQTHTQAVNEGLSMLEEIRMIGAGAVEKAKEKSKKKETTKQDTTSASPAADNTDAVADTAATAPAAAPVQPVDSIGSSF